MGNSVCRSMGCSKKNSLQSHEPSKYRKNTSFPYKRAISILMGLNNKKTHSGSLNNKKTHSGKKDRKDITRNILPPEIISEILSRLPVKVLVKFQLVCKQWYAIVQDRHFIESHMRRGSVRCFFTRISLTPSTSETFYLYCGCDGLLLRKSNLTHKYHIKNPTTHQVLELPDPKKTEIPMTFNFVRSTSEYKLVSTYDDIADCDGAFCEVLTVGRDTSWKPLKVPNLNNVDEKRKHITVVSTDSAVHWYQIGPNFSREVVSLDLAKECFTITTLPNNLYPSWEKVWALNWSGKLAFSDIVKEEIRVLVLEDYTKQKWRAKRTVVPLTFTNMDGYLEADLVPLSAESDTVWFWLKDKKLFSYNMKDGCILKTYESTQGFKVWKAFYELRPSLVTFKGMKPEKEFLNQQG